MRTAYRRDPNRRQGVVRIGPFWAAVGGESAPQECWSPAVNIYELEDRLEVCVDLAGVKRESLEVRVEPGRLVIRGQRRSPEPKRSAGQPMKIMSMEIDHGVFGRAIGLPRHVELTRVGSEYRDGLLWIRLPFRSDG